MKKESGFTLIEVIVTLILVGILASVAGLGIVTALNGYMFAKNNTIIAGKAQVALARMTRELMDLRDIPNPAANANGSFLVFNNVSDAVALGQSGTGIKIAKGSLGTTPDYVNGDVLTDQVATGGFNLLYKKGSADWTSSDNINELSHIVITLTMSGAGGGSNFTFNTTVNPRNNGNAGGTPPPTPAAPPPSAAGRCFVATAAYGNPYHPMVILLKQFRDQYLATWPGGRSLIQLYYEKGPYLAELIHDKPWARGLARMLLLPFIGLAFLLVYAKGSIPLVILIIIGAGWLVRRYAGQRIFMKKSPTTSNEKGSILIGLIVTMVIIAFLGAALVSLTSTSTLNQVYGAISQKAYYLAESGFRYAGSAFANVVDIENNGKNENQNAKANELNDRTLTMAEGSIHLNVTPFHYAVANAAAVGATALTVRFPGGTPTRFAIPSTGSIQIQTQYRPNSTTAYTTYTDLYNYTDFNGATFTLGAGLIRAVPAWTSVTVIAHPSSAQTITPNPDPALTGNRLTLTKPTAGFFMPERNGKFKIPGNPVVYRYDYRDNVNTTTSTTTLYGVANSLTPTSNTPFSVTTAASILPNDFFTVASTGTTGMVSRTLTYVTPIDITASAFAPAQKTTSADPFTAGVNPGDAGSNWYSPFAGSYSIANVSGGVDSSGQTALQLTNSSGYGGWSIFGIQIIANDKFFSLIPLKWGANYSNFSGSWLSHDQTLSYDAQVKMKLPQKDYYMAGFIFRLNLASSLSTASWLGASFLRGSNGNSSGSTDKDGMEDGVVPLNDVPLIVLWTKSAGQDITGIQWVAYKIISPTLSFNNGHSPYFTNGANSYYIRGGVSGARANVTAVVTTDGGSTGWLTVSSVYSTFQANEPLFILTPKSVTVSAGATNSSTNIDFNSGVGTAIVAGDIIAGASGARARVTGIHVSSGSWTSRRPATGNIDITEKEGANFQNNEPLTVYTPNSSQSANFVSYNSGLSDILTAGTPYIKDWSTLLLRIEEKSASSSPFSGQYVNDIRIYVGDTSTHGTPTGSPLDALRYGNLRWSNPPASGDVQWPPDAGWSSDLAGNLSKDHYTLVQGWVINPAFSSSFALRTDTTEEPNSTIRTNLFTTHSLSSFTQQEMGLQTAGADMSTSTNKTYFDDFGVQLEGSAVGGESGFTTPLQY